MCWPCGMLMCVWELKEGTTTTTLLTFQKSLAAGRWNQWHRRNTSTTTTLTSSSSSAAPSSAAPWCYCIVSTWRVWSCLQLWKLPGGVCRQSAHSWLHLVGLWIQHGSCSLHITETLFCIKVCRKWASENMTHLSYEPLTLVNRVHMRLVQIKRFSCFCYHCP